ncbi:PAS domain-containing sensor histidine kinase [Oceanobacillus zhaokaii]|uniref:histidine kinase n=1 Tax=Oceanobacillus zhaokaii TaxID=2052660 RepID=A0A345PI33_9BACI|nr:HAMP domain-containing sensor histidine kinase [Oceanobacillus zhaokaii]AXI09663.1 PAS domain-containing sensor histidine kinase [Oceanobacillus zhaokaii]
MSDLFQKPLFKYVIILFFIVLGSGAVLVPFIDNYLALGIVLTIEYIILLVILSYFSRVFLKPVEKAIDTMEEIQKGNYEVRLHNNPDTMVGTLNTKINGLASNLNQLATKKNLRLEQLNTLINNTESSLILIDERGYIQLINQKFMMMFGGKVEDFQDQLYYDVLENDACIKAVQKAFVSEKNIKESFTHYIGIIKYYYEISGIPIFNQQNNLKGAVLVIRDITELKKLESMRKDFVANVSHELRTPITSMKGFAETLLDGGMSSEETTREFLRIIYNESHRMQLLIEDLLTLSKLENENFRLVLNTVNVKDITKDIIPTLMYHAEAKKLKLHVDMEDNVVFKADKERVKQIFINLLDNAINYTPENGHIYLKVEKQKEYVHINVTDTGIGIDKEKIPRIFERFYRVDKARSRNTGGTGLGLAIIKHIVEVHEGKIEIESEVNKGTSMHVYLPL